MSQTANDDEYDGADLVDETPAEMGDDHGVPGDETPDEDPEAGK